MGGSSCVGTGCGTVFKLTLNPNGTYTETVIYAFKGGTDGSAPRGGVIADAVGLSGNPTVNLQGAAGLPGGGLPPSFTVGTATLVE